MITRYGYLLITSCFVALFLASELIVAQDTLPLVDDYFIQDKLETIGSQTDNPIDYSTLIDHLNHYIDHPLNINTASREELQELGLLNEVQIMALLNHIKQLGKLIEVYELQSIDGFNLETILLILPYITVVGNGNQVPISLKNIFTKGKHEYYALGRKILEPSIGYTLPITQGQLDSSKKFLGSPYKILMKYRYTFSDQITFGFTGEKDAGEPFKHGFDFNSAYLFYRSKGIVKTLAVGDYQLGFGQGLCLSSGLTFSKTGDVLSIKKMSRELLPNTAINENAFMRGIVATIAFHHFEFTPFYSYHKLDGNATSVDTLTQEASAFSSLGTSGYHRTYNELKNKHIIGEALYGGHLAYNVDKLNIGITSYHTKFDADFIKNYKLYNQFEFTGKTNNNYSLDYSYSFKNYNFFGELARSGNGGIASLNGILISVDSRTSISILHRKYQKDYQALQSNGFAESSGTNNEEGIYIGISSNLTKNLVISAYYDEFSFPWLKYLIPAPSVGSEFLTHISCTPNKKLQLAIRYKKTLCQVQSGYYFPIIPLVKRMYDDFRWTAHYKVSTTLRVASRVEMSQFARGDEVNIIPSFGYLISQDVVFKLPKSKLSFSLSYALFDGDSYYTRMYCYEDDLPNSFSVPSFYGQGTRCYLMMQYHLMHGINIWLRYAQTYYPNMIAFGTGLDMIYGNAKTDVAAEVKISF